jgi:DNA-binding helix-hairpin-helix protein with protein kinase domain
MARSLQSPVCSLTHVPCSVGYLHTPPEPPTLAVGVTMHLAPQPTCLPKSTVHNHIWASHLLLLLLLLCCLQCAWEAGAVPAA